MGRRTVPISRLLLALLPLAAAQLTPNPTWTPPDKSQGTVASSGSPNAQWATVLGNSLYFYDAQRSGNLSDGAYGNRVEWRNDSTLTDGSDYGLDLTGGWFDAGNVSGKRRVGRSGVVVGMRRCDRVITMRCDARCGEWRTEIALHSSPSTSTRIPWRFSFQWTSQLPDAWIMVLVLTTVHQMHVPARLHHVCALVGCAQLRTRL